MESRSPLAHVRVLDLTRLLPGPFCTRLLADQGAAVVKLEDPDAGDYLRQLNPQIFGAINHGKRSITLDLRREAGRHALLRLIPHFDVLVEGFRPGVLARLGCGYDTLRDVHPGLIYCAITGYGQQGEYAGRSGHDLNYMATAGLLSGVAGPLPIQAADFCGGYAAAFQIAAALAGRLPGGAGCFLDVSMTAAVLPMAVTRLAGDRLEGGLACYRLYRTADHQTFSLGALEPKFFAAFTQAVGRPELAALQFDLAKQAALGEALAEIFRQRSSAEWEQFFNKVDACGAPVRTPAQAVGSLAATGPRQGEHTAEVLSAAGFTAEEIQALRLSSA
jgi:crotonobetainyl-CoA:carnitine CoA-transferase CaiB-like acyl-CoA transferase